MQKFFFISIHKPPVSITFAPIKHALAVTVEPLKFSPPVAYELSHMIVRGTKYSQDLKIIQGEIKDNWWRQDGHLLHAADINDILSAEPEVLVIGTGYAGNMRVPVSLRTRIEDQDIKVIVEKTAEATKTFNHLFAQGKDVAGAFHLTC